MLVHAPVKKTRDMRKIILLVLLLPMAVFAQKPIFTSAKIKSATVYFNAAELNHSTTVNLPAGTSEVVVKNVANYISENTIQIGAPSSVTVLSVQFTTNYISEFEPDENSPVIRKVRDSIALVQKEIVKIQIEKGAANKAIDLLDRNQQVAGANNGLSVAELMKLIDYNKTERIAINNAVALLQEKENKLNATIQRLNTELQTTFKSEEKSSDGKLILQVMNATAGNVTFDINYITNTASWKPFYDLRADNTSSPLNMVYKAQVVQNSGVDWKKVKLTLSSGSPNQNNQVPQLNPWFLAYQQPVLSDLESRTNGIALSEVVIEGYKTSSKQKSSLAMSTVYAEQVATALTVNFEIDIPYDILSNGKAHSVALKEIKLPARYKHYAVPRVEKEAFLMASIDDYSAYNLLPGEANIIFEGMYVGKTMINPNETADTLNLSMGRDKRVSIKREKIVEKSGTKSLSGFKEQTFTYEIVIRNNKKETIQLLLDDQIPVSTDKEVTVELLDSDRAKIVKELGMLHWDLKLSPNETKKIRLSYKVRSPKDKVIANL
jgi:uncharacterized protein (TIGR02231 family)